MSDVVCAMPAKKKKKKYWYAQLLAEIYACILFTIGIIMIIKHMQNVPVYPLWILATVYQVYCIIVNFMLQGLTMFKYALVSYNGPVARLRGMYTCRYMDHMCLFNCTCTISLAWSCCFSVRFSLL